jgi:hypothetical protein
MTPKKIKTVSVEKSDYKIYLKKAKDLYGITLKARDGQNWTAVGLNAVHCAISCCDAMLTFHFGVRSSGEDHSQAADLILRINKDNVKSAASAYKRIIAKKNLVAYENREFRKGDAEDILKITNRFYEWTISNLPL